MGVARWFSFLFLALLISATRGTLWNWSSFCRGALRLIQSGLLLRDGLTQILENTLTIRIVLSHRRAIVILELNPNSSKILKLLRAFPRINLAFHYVIPPIVGQCFSDLHESGVLHTLVFTENSAFLATFASVQVGRVNANPPFRI